MGTTFKMGSAVIEVPSKRRGHVQADSADGANVLVKWADGTESAVAADTLRSDLTGSHWVIG